MLKTVRLLRGKAESLKRFHPWIFSGALSAVDPSIVDGDLVQVLDAEGRPVATGHYQRGTIAVRVLAFSADAIDDDFWTERLRQAYALRQSLGLAGGTEHTIYRLVHGEGDRLPGLVVDVYGKTAVVQSHSCGMHQARRQVAQAIVRATEGAIENVFYKATRDVHLDADAPDAGSGYLIGAGSETVATESGLRFGIDWAHGQKTGFFIDQRENRRLLERYARGRRLLNLFAYTGGFSVYAMRGGAQLVHTVDSSARAIDMACHNVELNFPGDTRHEAFAEDAFKFLEKSPTPYDLIILDPPAFAKHKSALSRAVSGYTRLNALAFKRIEPGGIIFTFSCSQAVSKEQFRLAVFTAAALSGRHVRILHQLHQPADHPINIYHPEGEYLKGLVLQVE